MAEPTAAEWASLKSAGQQCSTSSGAIDGAIKRMLSQLDGVQWKGAAANAFTNAKVSVEADVKTITDRLDAIANGIHETSTYLMSTDEDGKRLMDQSLDGKDGATVRTGTGGADISAGLR